MAACVAACALATSVALADGRAGSADVWPPEFREGMAPLPAPHVAAAWRASATCAQCHPREHEQWSRSRHKASATNALFVDGFLAEPHVRCANCHAATADGARDLVRARVAAARSSAGSAPVRANAPLELAAASEAHDGISCVVCHVRDDGVLVASDALPYGHDVRRADGLRDPAFCARCHEFSSHETRAGETRLTDVPLQSTYSEWRRYRDSGGEETCQSCHMPDGEHTFAGASDVALLRRSLDASIAPAQGGRALAVVLRSRGVGHAFPTGDVFRHLTVWAESERGRREVARLGRRYALVTEDGAVRQQLTDDTRLLPGEPRVVPLPRDTRAVVVTYHYADDAAERRARVSYDELVVELARIDVALSRPTAARVRPGPSARAVQSTR